MHAKSISEVVSIMMVTEDLLPISLCVLTLWHFFLNLCVIVTYACCRYVNDPSQGHLKSMSDVCSVRYGYASSWN